MEVPKKNIKKMLNQYVDLSYFFSTTFCSRYKVFVKLSISFFFIDFNLYKVLLEILNLPCTWLHCCMRGALSTTYTIKVTEILVTDLYIIIYLYKRAAALKKKVYLYNDKNVLFKLLFCDHWQVFSVSAH